MRITNDQGQPVSDEAHSYGLSSTAGLVAAVGLSLLLQSNQIALGAWAIVGGIAVSMVGVTIQAFGGFKSNLASIALGIAIGIGMAPLVLKATGN